MLGFYSLRTFLSLQQSLKGSILKYSLKASHVRLPMVKVQESLGNAPRMRDNPAFKKINTPNFRSIFTPELEALVALFKKYNYELRIAGGAVRDILMDIKPKDIDFATTATPEQMKEMFTKEEVRMINTKGEKHGTITPRIHNKENFEVTTLRIDVRTNGRHAEVQFTTDWQLDANRRDLTINSMFLGFDGTVYDYFYGYEDLQQRRVVFVGDAQTRIKEDYLRILRYFRFYGRIAQVANNHDNATLETIKSNGEGLTHISGERIWSELQKIVSGNFGYELVLEMNKCNLLQYCGLPKNPNLTEFKRLCKDFPECPDKIFPIMYLISLLDTADDAISLHARLKLSAFERDMALFIVQQKSRVDVDYHTLLDYQKLSMENNVKCEFVQELLKYAQKIDLYTQLKEWKRPSFPLNGNLLRMNGCPPGRSMGVVNSKLKLIWADSEFKLTADELLNEHLPKLLSELKSPPPTPTKKQRTY